MLNRRDAIRGLALTIGVGSFGLAGTATAAALPPPLTWTPTALTPDQARLVDVVAELLIPATDTPGARQAGVPQFIDRALADYYDEARVQLLRTGLDRMDADARAAHGDVFAALAPEQQVALLTVYDREASAVRNQSRNQPHFFLALEDMVTIGYFTSEPGATTALRYEQVPGEYHGCVPLAEVGRAWAT